MNKKIFNVIRIIAIIICFVVIIYELSHIYMDQKEYQVADEEYDTIRETVVSWPVDEDEAQIVDYPLLQIDFDKLESINNDFVA